MATQFKMSDLVAQLKLDAVQFRSEFEATAKNTEVQAARIRAALVQAMVQGVRSKEAREEVGKLADSLQAATAKAEHYNRVLRETSGAAAALAIGGIAKSLNDTTVKTNNLATSLREAGVTAEFTSRKIVAIADEIAAGRWSALSGTLTNVVGTLGQANILLGIMAAATGAVGYAAYQVAQNWLAVHAAIRQTSGQLLISGNLSRESLAGISTQIQDSKKTWRMWGGEAADLAIIIGGLKGPAAAFSKEIDQLAKAQAKLVREDPDKVAGPMVTAFNNGAAGALKWADNLGLFSGEAAGAKFELQDMAKAGRELEVINRIVQIATERFYNEGLAIAKAQGKLKEFMKDEAFRPAVAAGAGDLPFTDEKEARRSIGEVQVPDRPARDFKLEQDLELIQRNIEAERKRRSMQDELNQLATRRLMLNAEDEEGIHRIESAMFNLRREISLLHTPQETDRHEARLGQLQSEMNMYQAWADKRVAVAKRILALELEFSKGAETPQVRQARRQLAEQERQAADQALQQKLLILGQEEQRQRDHSDRLVEIAKRRVKAVEDAGKGGTVQHLEEINRLENYQRQAANREVAEKITAIRTEQEALRGNFNTQILLQDEILALIKQHYGEDTLQYKQEMQKRTELARQGAQQRADILKMEAAAQRQVSSIQTQMAVQLARFQQAQGARFPTMLSLLGGQDSTEQFREQMAQIVEAHRLAMETLQAQQEAALDPTQIAAALNAQVVEIAKFQQAMQNMQLTVSRQTRQDWLKTLESLEGGFNSSIGSMLRGSQTLAEGFRSIIADMIDNTIMLFVKMGQAWLNQQIINYVVGESYAQAQAAGSVAAHLAAETAKTNATLTAIAIRMGAITAETGVEVSGDIATTIAHQIAEASKTAATVGGVAARTGAEEAGAAESLLITVGSALKHIAIKAYETFANVYAAISAIPYVGPFLAPAAAAGALAAVMAVGSSIASAEGGWGKVPGDQIAQLHKNEMVLPAGIATPLRSMITKGQFSGDSPAAMSGGGGDTRSVTVNGPLVQVHGTNASPDEIARKVQLAMRNFSPYMRNSRT